MFEDILGVVTKKQKLDIYHGCPFCGTRKNIEEDGEGYFPNEEQYNQPMVCNTCEGRWTIEYDRNLAIKNVNRKV